MEYCIKYLRINSVTPGGSRTVLLNSAVGNALALLFEYEWFPPRDEWLRLGDNVLFGVVKGEGVVLR